jgi:hypothetical protein
VNGQPAGLIVREQEPEPALVEMNVLRADLQMSNAKMVFVIQVIFLLFICPCEHKCNVHYHSVGPMIWTYCLIITFGITEKKMSLSNKNLRISAFIGKQ